MRTFAGSLIADGRAAVATLAALLMAAAIAVLLGEQPLLGVGAAAGVVFLLVAVRDPALAVALWVPAFANSFSPVGKALLYAGFPAAAVAIVCTARGGAPPLEVLWRHRLRAAAALTLLAWATLTVLWARDAGLALDGLWRAGLAVFAAVAIVCVATTRRGVGVVVAGVMAGPLLSVAIGLVAGDAFAAGADTQGRLVGASGDANQLAAGLIPVLALAIAVLAAARGTGMRLLAVAAVTLAAIGIAASESRGGAVAAVAVLAMALVGFRGARGWVLAIGGVAIAAGAGYLAGSASALDRITDIDADGTGRSELWRVAASIATDHPLGVGLNNFRAVSAEYALDPGSILHLNLIVERPVVVHNTYLELLAETGFVGLLLFLLVVAGSLTAGVTAARRFRAAADRPLTLLATATVIALLGFLVASVFVSFGFGYRMWTLLALGPALLTVASRLDARGAPAGRVAAS